MVGVDAICRWCLFVFGYKIAENLQLLLYNIAQRIDIKALTFFKVLNSNFNSISK